MPYNARDYSTWASTLPGFTEEQLSAHVKLYEGYVKALNEIESKLQMTDRSEASYAYGDYSELKRRYAVAFNGVALHEMYFDNLQKPEGSEPNEDVFRLLEDGWGSRTDWESDLRSTAKSGPGWVITAYDWRDHRTENLFITEHHIGWPLRFEPLIVLDTWEHAYAIDFGMEKEEYFNTFLECLHWETVNERFRQIHKLRERANSKAAA